MLREGSKNAISISEKGLFDCKKIAHKIWTKLKKQNLLKNYSALGGQQEFLTIKSHGNVKRIGV